MNEQITRIGLLEQKEVIKLTEVHGGKFNHKNSHFDLKIKDLDDAILLMLSEKIAGFEIGKTLPTGWSPIGIVRKWGDANGYVQVKQVNSFGQEGSGVYGHIKDRSIKRYIDTLVDLATIPMDGMIQEHLRVTGKSRLTEDECKPEFKSL